MTNNEIKNFNRFLKENGLYCSYYKNLRNYIIKMQRFENVSAYLRVAFLTKTIVNGFEWSGTEEGYNFWYDASLKLLADFENDKRRI